jgi:FlaA1/EpsC-like NDP-sugar epimerase
MKRRDFLHLAIATTAGGAGPLFARPQQTGPVGANDRIRAAIIGCGNRGRAVAREWIEHADTTFVAACDVDKTRTDATVAEFAQAGHKAEGYEDYRRILERKNREVEREQRDIGVGAGLGVRGSGFGKTH